MPFENTGYTDTCDTLGTVCQRTRALQQYVTAMVGASESLAKTLHDFVHIPLNLALPSALCSNMLNFLSSARVPHDETPAAA